MAAHSVHGFPKLPSFFPHYRGVLPLVCVPRDKGREREKWAGSKWGLTLIKPHRGSVGAPVSQHISDIVPFTIGRAFTPFFFSLSQTCGHSDYFTLHILIIIMIISIASLIVLSLLCVSTCDWVSQKCTKVLIQLQPRVDIEGRKQRER